MIPRPNRLALRHYATAPDPGFPAGGVVCCEAAEKRALAKSLSRLLVAELLALFLVWPVLAYADNADIRVEASKRGEVLIVDVEMPVRVPMDGVWAVMSDWDNMQKFIPSVSESEILWQIGNRVRVQQSGKVPLGPFSVSYRAVRDIEVFPPALMRFTGVEGDFEWLQGSVRFLPDGEGTRVVYHAESVPTVWVPPFIGRAVLEYTTRAQFGEIRAEMLRRAEAKRAPSLVEVGTP